MTLDNVAVIMTYLSSSRLPHARSKYLPQSKRINALAINYIIHEWPCCCMYAWLSNLPQRHCLHRKQPLKRSMDYRELYVLMNSCVSCIVNGSVEEGLIIQARKDANERATQERIGLSRVICGELQTIRVNVAGTWQGDQGSDEGLCQWRNVGQGWFQSLRCGHTESGGLVVGVCMGGGQKRISTRSQQNSRFSQLWHCRSDIPPITLWPLLLSEAEGLLVWYENAF